MLGEFRLIDGATLAHDASRMPHGLQRTVGTDDGGGRTHAGLVGFEDGVFGEEPFQMHDVLDEQIRTEFEAEFEVFPRRVLAPQIAEEIDAFDLSRFRAQEGGVRVVLDGGPSGWIVMISCCCSCNDRTMIS